MPASTSLTGAPEIIHQLVAKFAENRDAYRSDKYKEAQLRQEFIDKFFEALGWDIYNTAGVAPDYSDVIIEDSLEIEGATKAPDYAFKIGRERKFYVEAKKPAVHIESDIHPAYQLRRYAWNAHLPLSILTDFEEFAVYNCKNKPNPTDSAGTGREKFYHYTDYVEKWDEIAAIFSKDAVWKGAFDRFAETSKGKQGTTEVDDAFLHDIEEWRLLLARNIALRNLQIADEHQLNYAVQMTIDRIIFLRICEDRGIEPTEQLKTIASVPNIYAQLVDLFRRADMKYNSGLFHFSKEKGSDNSADSFTPALKIDDKVLKEIITSIYYPCPYIFKEIPVEILGQVYEQFLGKVIRLTAGHQAKVEEKPEVRKAGGVYYTPKYIVDYIVENTVGKLLEGKTPDQAAELKIVDPACGSGSFLLGAYQHLLDWHLDWYIAHEPEQWSRGKNPALVAANGGGWKLTTARKKEILVNNIHGVDIDAQAVEVTKLSLLLKVLEGESGQLSLGFERVLPDLSRNIQCGNSLIGEDYYEGQFYKDPKEYQQLNIFEWERAFSDIFLYHGGFDAIIGNPPYIRIQAMREWAPNQVNYFKKKYLSSSVGNYDIYVIFVEKSLALINKKGYLGFILPSKFYTTDYGNELRDLISLRKAILKIVDFSHFQVFENATTYTSLLFLSTDPHDDFDYAKVGAIKELEAAKFVKRSNFKIGERWGFLGSVENNLAEKMQINSSTLGSLPSRIARGSSSGADDIFILKENAGKYFDKNGLAVEVENEILRKPIFATDFGRYIFTQNSDEFIIFPYSINDTDYEILSEQILRSTYPKTYKYLLGKKKELENRKQYIKWYGFSAPRNLDVHEKANFLVPLLANEGKFCFFNNIKDKYCLMASGGFSITLTVRNNLSPNFVLGLLNSKLLFWRLKSISNVFRGGWVTCTKQYIETLPIRAIDFSDPAEFKLHDRIVALVERMLELHKQQPLTPQEQERLARDIAATDREIDALVYQLYGLTDEEIKIVEGV